MAKGFLFFLQFLCNYSQVSKVVSTFLPSPCPIIIKNWAWLFYKPLSLLGMMDNGAPSTPSPLFSIK